MYPPPIAPTCPDGISVGGLCIAKTDTPGAIINTCSDSTWDFNLANNAHCANNAWAGAKKVCSDQGMRLPTMEELAIIFANKGSISGLNLSSNYWSSINVDNSPNVGWTQNFANGLRQEYNKQWGWLVRCLIR